MAVTDPTREGHEAELRALGASRWRVAITLTLIMTAVYFGFILLVAYGKEWLGKQLVPGLSWAILLGAAVILAAWLLTFVYVRWANDVFDPKAQRLRGAHDEFERKGA